MRWGGVGRSPFPYFQEQDNNPGALCSTSEPEQWNSRQTHTGLLLLLPGEQYSLKNQMSWPVAGRAYVIKLFHDIQSRSHIRTKNYAFTLAKCWMIRTCQSHPKLHSNFSPLSMPIHSPLPSLPCLPLFLIKFGVLNTELDATHSSVKMVLWFQVHAV